MPRKMALAAVAAQKCYKNLCSEFCELGQQFIRLCLRSDNSNCCCCCWVAQSCPTLCDPRDGSPPGSPVPGVLQARTLEWVAMSFSSAWKWKAKVKSLSRVRLFATPWTAAHQAPPPVGFSRQEDWSGCICPLRQQQQWMSKKQELGEKEQERTWFLLVCGMCRVRDREVSWGICDQVGYRDGCPHLSL